MANLTVSGAGASAVNGTYVESGTYNGKAAYDQDGASRWLWWYSVSSRWVITGSKGLLDMSYYYSTGATPLSADTAWSNNGMTAPPPTVTEEGGGGAEVDLGANYYG